MPYLKLQNIWTDDDGMLQIEVTASNDFQVIKQDFYVYPKALVEFGNQLQDFPKTQTDTVSFEYGIEPDYYCYFLMRAIILDGSGHSAIEIKTDNRLKPPEKSSSNFFMSSEVATINNFGKALNNWVKDIDSEFMFKWKNI